MANFLSGALGNKGLARIAGEKAGDIVEDTVNKVLSGKKKSEETKGGGGGGGGLDVLSNIGGKKDKGGFDLGDVLSSAGGKEQDKGGLNVGDALSLIGGAKDEGKGGLDLNGAVNSLFK